MIFLHESTKQTGFIFNNKSILNGNTVLIARIIGNFCLQEYLNSSNYIIF